MWSVWLTPGKPATAVFLCDTSSLPIHQLSDVSVPIHQINSDKTDTFPAEHADSAAQRDTSDTSDTQAIQRDTAIQR